MLYIIVFVPKSNYAAAEEDDFYVHLLVEAFAHYLKLSDKSKFECPGLESVSETENEQGRTTCFRIPASALKVLEK